MDEAVLLLQARKQLLHSSPRSVTRISRSRLAQRCRRSLALGWHCHPLVFAPLGLVRSPEESAEVIAAFRQGLRDGGFVENQNLKMELRWAEGEYARLTPFAAELVDRGVAVIVAIGPPAGTAAKAATASGSARPGTST